MYLTLPDDLGLDAATARQVLAVALYRQGRANLAQACRLAEVDQAAFRELLAREAAATGYGVTQLEEDLATLAGRDGP